MTDDELLRYSRHVLLNEIGFEGQQRIQAAHVLIIGAGGLGSPVALYLASAGVGHLSVVDHDRVDLTNLQRQVAHTTASVGQAKVRSLQNTLKRLNPAVQVSPIEQRADAALLDELVPQVDVVVDCCDNFATRQAVNAACVGHHKSLVSGAAIRFDGQLMVYDPRDARSACYACLYPPELTFEEARCATMGVFAPLVGIIGCMQAAEALKLIAHAGSSSAGRLLMLDARSMEFSSICMERNVQCSVCGTLQKPGLLG